jgi:4-aminobutyrate--pyruvate transaminase
VSDNATEILQDNGLIVRNMGDSIAFCPPLVIREGEIDEMFDIVDKGLRILEERVLKENLRN